VSFEESLRHTSIVYHSNARNHSKDYLSSDRGNNEENISVISVRVSQFEKSFIRSFIRISRCARSTFYKNTKIRHKAHRNRESQFSFISVLNELLQGRPLPTCNIAMAPQKVHPSLAMWSGAIADYADVSEITREATTVVVRAVHRPTDEDCAVTFPGDDCEQTHCEAQILRGMSHPAIIELKAVFDTEDGPALVLPFAFGGDFFTLVAKHCVLPESGAMGIAFRVLSALDY
jgi:hypothetical protein